MAEPQYTRKDAKLKVMPIVSEAERAFVQEMLAKSSYSDAWTRAFDPQEKLDLTDEQRKTKARALLKKRRIRQWMEYLEGATADELVEDLYVKEIAFGEGKVAMQAAGAFMDSRFAGKEVAEIFIRTLHEIQAEIVVPCGTGACAVKLGT